MNEFKDLDIKNYTIIKKDERQVIYKLNKFELKNNISIFTNTYFLKDLFYLLKNLDSKYNINLITHQTDHLLNYELFKKKPKCIKKWYSINLEHQHQDLIPIPLGLSNNYSPKNLLPDDFKNFINTNSHKKENKLYINFNPSTNFNEREVLYDKFRKKDWVELKESSLSRADYYKDLSRFSFSLAPWGNGIDTHRVWESLYLGTIPVTKYHHTFSTSSDLPILFVNNYDEISEELLQNYLQKYNKSKFNFEKLNNNYWCEFIKPEDVETNVISIQINSSKITSEYFIFLYKFRELIYKYYKIINFYIKKLRKLIRLIIK